MDGTAIQFRKVAREAAEEVINLAEGCVSDHMDKQRFWEVLAETAATRAGLEIGNRHRVSAPMSDEAARKFSLTVMSYGKFAGEQICDIDGEYLAFIVENEFAVNLARYIRSRYFRKLENLPLLD